MITLLLNMLQTSFGVCFDRNREQSDDDTLSSSSTEFSTDMESDGMAEPLINLEEYRLFIRILNWNNKCCI